MAPAIEFHNVSKRFWLHRDQGDTLQERFAGLFRGPRGKEFWALRDISFRVDQGHSFGLIGHNGAGKSTLLKLMTRILTPTSGQIHLQGRVAALLELGSGFHPELSGRENVFLYGSLMGLGRREMLHRLPEIVEFAEIGDFLDIEVKHYSSGMYTRLAFAAATSVDPDILITDEVLAVGDESFQRKCMERIYQFRHAGKTIIYVSHALDTVRALCDEAIWLDHGLMRASGPSGAVIDAYLHDVNQREQVRLAERSADPNLLQDSRRRGTREIEIVRVELLDASGTPQQAFQTGDTMLVRLHYHAPTSIRRPVFGVSIHHETGVWMCGPNTRFDELVIESVSGSGSVTYTIAALPLLNGNYTITAVVFDEAMLVAFDVHDRMYPFQVQSPSLRERYGLVRVAGTWEWETQVKA